MLITLLQRIFLISYACRFWFIYIQTHCLLTTNKVLYKVSEGTVPPEGQQS